MNQSSQASQLTSRRRFLHFSSFVVLSTFLKPLLGAQNENRFGSIPMGIHGASFRRFSLEETLELVVSELGLSEIELTAAQIRLHGAPASELASEQDARAVRRQLDSAEVQATAYGFVPMDVDEELNTALFRKAQILGVRNLTVIPADNSLDHLEPLADQFDIRLAIHNNAPESAYDSMEEVYQAVDSRGANIGACVDVGNVLRSNEDPAAAVRQLGEKVFGIHLKDVSSRSADSEVIGLGEGYLDTESFFAALRESSLPTDVACSLEYLAQPTNPIPNLSRSLELAERLLS